MINRLRVFVQNILPLVYDDSLSYYEVLCKVVAKINEIINYVNTDFSEYIKEQIGQLLSGAMYRASDKTIVISEEEGDVTTGGDAEYFQLGNVKHPVVDNEARLSVSSLSDDVDGIKDDIEDIEDDISNLETAISNINISYVGKNIVFFGDSWTVGGSASVQSLRFSSLIAEKLGMVEWNYGVGGAGFCIPGNLISSQISSASSEMSADEKNAVAVVVITGGVNDWRHRVDYSITRATFRTAVAQACATAQAIFPNAKVFCGIGNSTLTGMTEDWKQWYVNTQAVVRQSTGNRAEIIPWLAERVNYNAAMFKTDELHLTDAGHAAWAGHIAQYIIGGYCDVHYHIGQPTLQTGVELEGFHLFRDNYEISVTPGDWGFSSAITENTLVGNIAADKAPSSNIYIPIYYSNACVGSIAITYNGAVRIIPNSGASIPNCFVSSFKYTLDA